MPDMSVVNDFEKVKNCFRGELEILTPIKPNTMTRMAEVKRNGLSVIARKCLSVHLPVAAGAVHGVTPTLCNMQPVDQQLSFPLDVFEHLHHLLLFTTHPNCFTPGDFMVVAKQM